MTAPLPEEGTDEQARQETPAERLDRNWNELVQELRVAQTGAQFLAAFLFTVPFQQRFDRISGGQLALYLTCVGLACLTTALIVAPAAWHRSTFREGRKAALVASANTAARAGLFSLSLVVACTVSLVFWVSLDATAAIWAAAISAMALTGGWFVLPLALPRAGGGGAGARRTPS